MGCSVWKLSYLTLPLPWHSSFGICFCPVSIHVILLCSPFPCLSFISLSMYVQLCQCIILSSCFCNDKLGPRFLPFTSWFPFLISDDVFPCIKPVLWPLLCTLISVLGFAQINPLLSLHVSCLLPQVTLLLYMIIDRFARLKKIPRPKNLLSNSASESDQLATVCLSIIHSLWVEFL